jgi:hypothetical protein
MSDNEARNSESDSLDSPIPILREAELSNSKKRPLTQSPQSDSSISPTVQKNTTTKFRKVLSTTMDAATKKFFQDLILQSEERTKTVIQSEVASVKKDLVKVIDSLESRVLGLQLELEKVNGNLRKKIRDLE